MGPELKGGSRQSLKGRTRDRSTTAVRPNGAAREIEQWAREHDLPYFDERVHFPDVRIECELEGRHQHLDIEVVTPHYRGAHAASRASCGFTCYASRGKGGGGRLGGLAEEFL